MVALPVCLIILFIGFVIGVVLGIWVRQKKGGLQQRKGISQESCKTVNIGTTEVEECAKDHTYDFVCAESSTERRGVQSQLHGLDLEAQDYVSMYSQVGGETYEELQLQSSEGHRGSDGPV